MSRGNGILKSYANMILKGEKSYANMISKREKRRKEDPEDANFKRVQSSCEK